jgi:hypothetical protein
MPISITNPIAAEAKTYDELWLTGFHVYSKPDSKCLIKGILDVVRTKEDGSKEVCPDGHILFSFTDFFADATPEELSVMYQLVDLIKIRLKL